MGEPGAVAGVSGRWLVEGELQGARSLFSWLCVAFASRHEGSMNGFCLWPPYVGLDIICTSL